MSATPFVQLYTRTPDGPNGGPGQAAAYAQQAVGHGYTALGCADQGSVAGWASWDVACRAAGVHPIFGLEVAVGDEGAALDAVLLLAQDGAGIQNLVRLHNPAADGPMGADTLRAHAAGLLAILLSVEAPTSAPSWQTAFGMDDLYVALPADPARQGAVAARAATHGWPLLALPLACYPEAAAAPAYAALCAGRGVAPEAGGPIQAPDAVVALYSDYPAALAATGVVAARCTATLADLVPPPDDAACATLAERVQAALAQAGRAESVAVRAELDGLARRGLCRALAGAADYMAAAQAAGVMTGAVGGVAAAGQVVALLRLLPPEPFGAWPRWLEARAGGPDLLPAITVAACCRAQVLAALPPQAGGRWVPTAAGAHLGPIAALRLAGQHTGLGAEEWAALTAQLAALPARSAPFAALAADPSAARLLADLPDGADVLTLAAVLVGTPGPPAPDLDTLVWQADDAPLPLLLGDDGQPYAAWPAGTLAALGWPLLLVHGDPALDLLQHASELASANTAPTPNASPGALLLTAGLTAGLPIALAGDGAGVGGAWAAVLLPDGGAESASLDTAILGALVGGARPHPWAGDAVARRAGGAIPPVPAPLVPVLAPTWGLPLFREQIAAAHLHLDHTPDLTPGDRFNLQAWLDAALPTAVSWAEAMARGRALAQAVTLKAQAPAAFLAAALTQAAARGDGAGRAALLAEAPALGVTVLPPDVDHSAAAFMPEGGDEDAPAVRWGLLGLPGWTAAGADALVQARAAEAEGRFPDLAALQAAAAQVGVPPFALATLIRAGACDRWGERSALLQTLGDHPEPIGDSSPATHRSWEVALLGQAWSAPPLPTAAPRNGRGMATLDLRGLGADHVGKSVTLPVVLDSMREVATPNGPPLALVVVSDPTGTLPLVLYPPVYGRVAPLCVPGAAVLVTARVQWVEVGAGGGSPLVLVAERLAPYVAAEQITPPEVAPVTRRASAPRAPRKTPDPTEFSKSGQRYYRAPRDEVAPPPDIDEPPIEAYDSPPIEAYDDPPDYHVPHTPSAPPARIAEAPPAPAPASVAPPPAPPGPPPAIHITLLPLADEEADAERMRRLRDILRQHRGSVPVTLVFPGDQPATPPEQLTLKYGVDVGDALCTAITALLGAECLVMG